MKKYFSISALALFSVLCLSVTLSSCDKDDKDKEGNNSIVGTWSSFGYEECREFFSFSSDGTGLYWEECEVDEEGKEPFTWIVRNNILTLVWYEDNNDTDRFEFVLDSNKLYIYDDEDDYYIYERVR